MQLQGFCQTNGVGEQIVSIFTQRTFLFDEKYKDNLYFLSALPFFLVYVKSEAQLKQLHE